MLKEIILERTINDVTVQCGYTRYKDEPVASVALSNVDGTMYFDNITEARSAFWSYVKELDN